MTDRASTKDGVRLSGEPQVSKVEELNLEARNVRQIQSWGTR